MELLEQADRALFLFLNGLHFPWLDPVMELFSAKLLLIPFYLFLLYLLYRYAGWKGVLITIPFIALVILLADQGSVHLFKNVFERLRPCHEPEIAHLVYDAGHCGGKYGFVSSHAANSAAVAVFLGLILRLRFHRIWMLMSAWVLLVGYSRIYFGVHYPGDLLGGWIFGGFCGWLVWYVYQKIATRWLTLS